MEEQEKIEYIEEILCHIEGIIELHAQQKQH